MSLNEWFMKYKKKHQQKNEKTNLIKIASKKIMRLEKWIKIKGWTKNEFAEKFGVSKESVRLWTLHNKIPAAPTLKRLQKFTKGAITKESFEIETLNENDRNNNSGKTNSMDSSENNE